MHLSLCITLAAFEGHDALIKVLVDAGAEINALTDDNRTPLFQAAFKNHKTCVEALLEHGADAGVKNAEEKTAADVTTDEDIKALLGDVPAAKRRKVSSEKETQVSS